MFMLPSTLAFFGPLGWPEMLVLMILGVLIFGKRLPEVGKSVGKGIVEFKKGLAGINDDMDDVVKSSKQLEDPQRRSATSEATPDAKVESPSTHSA